MISIGTLKYFDDEWKINIRLDDDLVDFYRSLIPKHIRLNKTKFPPHITVVRNEEIPNKDVWKKYEGLQIQFKYGYLASGEIYWWLPVYCRKLTLIRKELGLPPSSKLTRPPNNRECFHITIGNMKGL
jgi:hypothetical protein